MWDNDDDNYNGDDDNEDDDENKQIQRIYVPRHYCSKPHAYLQTMSKTTVKLRTQGTHYLFTLIVKTLKND